MHDVTTTLDHSGVGAHQHSAALAVCIGASKAGTTTLFEVMRRHPNVCVSSVKETNFFFKEQLFEKGYDWYLSNFFEPSRETRVLFDADPAYQVHRIVFDRIKSCAPDARVILMIRNPIERAFSQYLYRVQLGRTRESFEDVCAREPDRIAVGGEAVNEHGYLERSRYGRYIAQLLDVFQREQVHFIKFEDFVARQGTVVADLQAWLGLSPVASPPLRENVTARPRSQLIAKLLYDSRLRNLRDTLASPLEAMGIKQFFVETVRRLNEAPFSSEVKPALKAETRQKLVDFFLSDIELTETLTGLDLADWKVYRPE